jgi:hypothetical protein
MQYDTEAALLPEEDSLDAKYGELYGESGRVGKKKATATTGKQIPVFDSITSY